MAAKKAAVPPQTDSERNLAAAMAMGHTPSLAVGVAVGHHVGAKDMAAKIERAMQAAVAAAQAEGVTDPAELRNRMLIARDQVRGGG